MRRKGSLSAARRFAACALLASISPIVGCDYLVKSFVEWERKRQDEIAKAEADGAAAQSPPIVSAPPVATPATPVATPSVESAPPAPTVVEVGEEPVDLSPYANIEFRQSRMASIPTGDQTFGGVAFRIGEKMLALQGRRHAERPREILGIRIDRPCTKIHFVQATAGGGSERQSSAIQATAATYPEGEEVGEYVVRYADGATERIPLRYGEDFRDWWDWERGAPTSRATVCWTASDEDAGRYGLKVNLYKLTWTNPRPDAAVEAIDFRSNGGASAPFCVAITVDGGSRKESSPYSSPAPSIVASPAAPSSPSPVASTTASSAPPVRPKLATPAKWEFPFAAGDDGPSESFREPSAIAALPTGPLDSAGWKAALQRVVVQRDRAVQGAIDALHAKLLDARTQASLESQNDEAATLESDASSLRADSFRAPKSKLAGAAATAYFSERVALERDAVAAFQELRSRAPATLSDDDRADVGRRISAIESDLARLALSQRLLAASSASRTPTRASRSDPSKNYLGPAPVHWEVVVDGPKQKPFPISGDLAGKRLENVLPEHAYYPPGPASVMFVATGPDRISGFRVVDLRTMNSVGPGGEVPGLRERTVLGRFADTMTLSNDARQMALFVANKELFLTIDIQKREVGTIPWKGSSPYLSFLANDRLLVVDRGDEPTIEALSVPEGDLLSKSTLSGRLIDDVGLIATSPGGRYLVVCESNVGPVTARFFDLEKGRYAGALELAEGGLAAHFRCYAFSHDGKEFAAYMAAKRLTDSGSPRYQAMVVFDVESGRPTYIRRIDEETPIDLGAKSDAPLQWFPDGRGWLLLQRYVVDRDGGAVSQKFDGWFDSIYGLNGAKILDDRSILVADGRNAMHVVEADRKAESP